MRELISKRTGKVQIVNDETWTDIVARGWAKRFKVTELPIRELKDVPLVEKITKKKKDE